MGCGSDNMGVMNTTTNSAPTILGIQAAAKQAIDLYLPGQGWSFTWDRAKKRMGCCNFRTRTISLSLPIFEIPENRVHADNTIRHEVAHAIAGAAAGHGPTWRAAARQVGATPNRCGSVEALPVAAYIGSCSPFCTAEHRRHRRPDPNGRWRCRRCGGDVTWHANEGWAARPTVRERAAC